jgi:hypothetical protein
MIDHCANNINILLYCTPYLPKIVATIGSNGGGIPDPLGPEAQSPVWNHTHSYLRRTEDY